MNLPDPRKDGQCCDCGSKPAETNDRRFCKACLRKRIKAETPDPKAKAVREQRGRKARDTKTLGGTTEMFTFEEAEDWYGQER